MKLRIIAIILVAVLLAATFAGCTNATGNSTDADSATGTEAFDTTGVKVVLSFSLIILLPLAVCTWGEPLITGSCPDQDKVDLFWLLFMIVFTVAFWTLIGILCAAAMAEQMQHPTT